MSLMTLYARNGLNSSAILWHFHFIYLYCPILLCSTCYSIWYEQQLTHRTLLYQYYHKPDENWTVVSCQFQQLLA